MAYIKGTISTSIYNFIKRANSSEVEDPDKAIRDFANALEDIIIDAISQMDVVAQAGTIVVATSTGPALNPTPIILSKAII